MESTWGLANFMWVALLIGLVALAIYESGKTEAQRKQEIEQARQRYEQDRLSRKIVEVVYLGIGGRKDKCGGVKGAMLGGFLHGLPGALIGAALPINRVIVHWFAIKYGNGEVAVREVEHGSCEYKSLMNRVRQS